MGVTAGLVSAHTTSTQLTFLHETIGVFRASSGEEWRAPPTEDPKLSLSNVCLPLLEAQAWFHEVRGEF